MFLSFFLSLHYLCLVIALEFTYSHQLHFSEASGRFIPQPTNISNDVHTLKTKLTTVYRPHSMESFHQARLRSIQHSESANIQWDPIQIQAPDVEDTHTLAQLARMTANAYASPGQKNWYDIDFAWNTVSETNLSIDVTNSSRVSHLVGKTLKMVSVATSLYLQTTLQSSYPSKYVCLYFSDQCKILFWQGYNSSRSHIKEGQIQR